MIAMTSERSDRTFGIVKQAVDALDPMGLLDMGAPPDEYDLESGLIADRLSADTSFQRIAQIMADEFSLCFSEHFSADHFLLAAEKIKLALDTGTESSPCKEEQR